MTIEQTRFRLQAAGEPYPWSLLLEADPSQSIVEGYLAKSSLWRLERSNQLLGIYVLTPISEVLAEVKNIAVDVNQQRRGYGFRLLQHASEQAQSEGYIKLRIGTGNTSIDQQRLYQKAGFSIVYTDKGFFTRNYPTPIFEHGALCTDMVVLEKDL